MDLSAAFMLCDCLFLRIILVIVTVFVEFAQSFSLYFSILHSLTPPRLFLLVIRVPALCDAQFCISVFCPSTTMLRCSTCGTSFPPKALVAKQRPVAAASQLPLGAGASA
jgi:hypothetical protein